MEKNGDLAPGDMTKQTCDPPTHVLILVRLWPPPLRVGQSDCSPAKRTLWTLFQSKTHKAGIWVDGGVEMLGMWLATWQVSFWVPKGRGVDRSLFKDLQQARGSHLFQPSSPLQKAQLWSLSTLMWIPPAFFFIPLKVTPDPSPLGWVVPLAPRNASLLFRLLTAKRRPTWEGNTCKVKNSQTEKYPNSSLRQELYRSCVNWADNRPIL